MTAGLTDVCRAVRCGCHTGVRQHTFNLLVEQVGHTGTDWVSKEHSKALETHHGSQALFDERDVDLLVLVQLQLHTEHTSVKMVVRHHNWASTRITTKIGHQPTCMTALASSQCTSLSLRSISSSI